MKTGCSLHGRRQRSDDGVTTLILTTDDGGGNPPSRGHRLEREGAGAQIAGGDAERSTLARAD